ncbi:MAG: hypothetical protein FWD53_05080 [Phycisphaerales bacterium]|nr:hypothetical protein [Phycisphaerales bacterium]
MTLSQDTRQRLDAHLDAVEQALTTAGNTREQRRAIIDDLEAQINEMLAARSASPILADVEAVLAQVDPPSAYGNAAPPSIPSDTVATSKPRYSRTAIWGLHCILASLVVPATMALLVYLLTEPPSANSGACTQFSIGSCMICSTIPLGILGTVLGWVAFGQIRASQGQLRGTGLALFDGLFYLVVLMLVLLLTFA